MDNIQDKLNAYKEAISSKQNIPAWIAYHIKTPLSKNITITEWNAIVEDIKELASDDEATVAFITQLTDDVINLCSRIDTLTTQISHKSQAYIYGTFTEFIKHLLTKLSYVNAGDTVFTIQTGSPDFIVVDTDVYTEYLQNTVPIPDEGSIPTTPPDAGVIYYVANKYYIMAIESGVSAPDLGIDSELDLYSPRAVMNSVITAAINNLYDYFSGYTTKVDENIERINSLDSELDTVESIALQANQAIAFQDYYTMISELQMKAPKELTIGQNIYINNVGVPDLWVSANDNPFRDWFYADDTSDEGFIAELLDRGFVSIGYYCLSMLETQKVNLTEYATKDDLNALSDEFSQVLIDLHNYAMNLKGGEA